MSPSEPIYHFNARRQAENEFLFRQKLKTTVEDSEDEVLKAVEPTLSQSSSSSFASSSTSSGAKWDTSSSSATTAFYASDSSMLTVMLGKAQLFLTISVCVLKHTIS